MPVVFLSGPAAYLFMPLALAVVFAMLASYFLSRTLVPTMVLYLLPKPRSKARQPRTEQTTGPWPGPDGRQRLLDVHLAIRRPSTTPSTAASSGCAGLPKAARLGPGPPLWHAAAVLLGFAAGLGVPCFPALAQDFFPTVDAGQFRLHVRAPAGTRIEETERIFGQVEDAIREVVPESERAMILDNMGLTQSFTDHGLHRQRHGQRRRRRNPGRAEARAPAHGGLRRSAAEELPRRFPQCTFFFEPADITSQILNFGLPAPIDVQVVGVNREGNLAVAQKIRSEIAKVPGIADVHLHQVTERPDLRMDVDRIMASELGLTQQDVAGSMLVSLSSQHPDVAQLLGQPDNRVNYRVAVQTPHDQVNSIDTLMSTPIINTSERRRPASPTSIGQGSQHPQDRRNQLLSNLVDLRRTVSAANINHYNVQPIFDVYANVQGATWRRSRPSAAGHRRRSAESCRGAAIVMRGQVQTMNSSFTGLAAGLAFAVLLVYLLMVGQFPVAGSIRSSSSWRCRARWRASCGCCS